MAEYGLTPKGPNIKRLDDILSSMHDNLTRLWGVNTRQNPESFLNHHLTEIADKIAELWEFGEDIYYSQYPSSAEGTSLDNAAQFGGAVRETAAKSTYPIHCTGKDGTTLDVGTMIASETNPITYLSLSNEGLITRNSFNKAEIKVASAEANAIYTVALNGAVYSFTSTSNDTLEILDGIQEAITDNNFTITVDREKNILALDAKVENSTNTLILSENLTTETVTSIITFGTTETGDILVPNGVITKIVKADIRLLKVVNLCGYIAGRKKENDAAFRRSYTDKIFNRSSMMLESIRSAILNNVLGVTAVAPYENATNEVDESGRPPHSIEIVVDGGDAVQIAQQILEKKAGGIVTYGDTEVTVAGAYDEDIKIRFSRPTVVYTWFKLGISLSKTEQLPTNYVEILRNVITENMSQLDAGEDVIPQSFMTNLYSACPGISYIDIVLFTTTNSAETPTVYTERSKEITARQRAYTTESMIEVTLNA